MQRGACPGNVAERDSEARSRDHGRRKIVPEITLQPIKGSLGVGRSSRLATALRRFARTNDPMHPSIRTRSADSAEATATAAAIAAERALRAPIASLRLLLEGARAADGAVDRAAFERMIVELEHVERAALDLASWSRPRALRTVRATIGELVHSIRASLDRCDRQRVHFEIEARSTALRTDGRLLADALRRCLLERLESAPGEDVMLHAHADEHEATFSIVDVAPAPGLDEVLASGGDAPVGIAESLFVRDVERLGGRATVLHTGAHRCALAVVPVSPLSKERTR